MRHNKRVCDFGWEVERNGSLVKGGRSVFHRFALFEGLSSFAVEIDRSCLELPGANSVVK